MTLNVENKWAVTIKQKEQSMSMDSAEKFVERIKTDREFRERVAEAESPEVKARILKYEGFDFTDEELDS